ncbi:MAG: helix-hairpin-helix domain-containing protein [Sulfurimonas sp.]|nr:helix-hairpin-helix domain-containing protein [Sulfurimonas sp.]
MKIILGMLLLVSLMLAGVDLNTASFDELIELKGIGKKKAKRILIYRKKHCFESIKELKKVKGIGKKKAKKIIKKNKGEIEVSECEIEVKT